MGGWRGSWQEEEKDGRDRRQGREEKPPCAIQAEGTPRKAEARPRFGAVPERSSACCHCFAPWSVWPMRWLRLGGRRARLLQEEAREEEEDLRRRCRARREDGPRVGMAATGRSC